jgi:Holliday junction resolvase-like predicted endonuclease
MPSQAFLRDRRRGEAGQRIVAGVLQAQGYEVTETPRGYHPGYDLLCKGKGLTFSVEVKTDYKMSETGNVCIETSSLKKSAASILAIVNEQTVYITPLQEALSFALKYPSRQVGENGWATVALIPKDRFIEDLKPKVLTTKI